MAVNNNNNNNQLTQKYITHDNGSRPFEVTIIDNGSDFTVDIKKHIFGKFSDGKTNYGISNYVPLQIINNVSKVFVGKCPQYSGWGDGNSILLFMGFENTLNHPHYGEPKYIFIGTEIYSFYALNIINEYHSPIGNSDVPYPYAIDTDNRYYLMIEDHILNDKHKQEDIFKDNNDPYMDYYGHTNFKHSHNLIFNKRRDRQHNKEFLNKYNIKTIYFACAGDEDCTNFTNNKCKKKGKCDFKKMEYNFGHKFNYDQCYDNYNNGQFAGIYVVYNTNDTNDKEENLHKMTKQEYITLMTDFADMRGYVYFDKTIICPRL